VQSRCRAENVDYETVRNIYQQKIQGVTGPSHIPGLFQVSKV
jgi:hypothetical protein